MRRRRGDGESGKHGELAARGRRMLLVPSALTTGAMLWCCQSEQVSGDPDGARTKPSASASASASSAAADPSAGASVATTADPAPSASASAATSASAAASASGGASGSASGGASAKPPPLPQPVKVPPIKRPGNPKGSWHDGGGFE